MEGYPHQEIEKKWQEFWEKNESNRVTEDLSFPKEKRLYILDMFPYPSGEGLHVGHPEGYTATDILSRYYRLNGYNVLHPMGWDAFGLPAENYAIKTKIHPSITTQKNINTFTRQIKSLGFSYDWSRTFSTTDPEYFKWTQWIFLKFFEKGLAYKSKAPINYCPSCKTGVANEEVVNGCCERCGTPVERRLIDQWLLKITAYADRLLDDLELVDWPDDIKTMQKNWIGRSEGANIIFDIDKFNERIEVFTTRADTIFGATYLVLAPEHPLVDKITTSGQKKEVLDYKQKTLNKSDLERTSLNKEKTGAFTGSYAIHPLSGKLLPIYISDYILMHYGTGAIMAVPAHDERDFDFASKFRLPIVQVVAPERDMAISLDKPYVEDGYSINSAQFSGLPTSKCAERIIEELERMKKGKRAVTYKLRDWIFSRQRYWGEPIPIINCPDCGHVPLKYEQLPLLLPLIDSYEPAGDGTSPLSKVTSWVNVKCPKCGADAKRETNTMPNWAGSCWYYLRYTDPHNDKEFASIEKQSYWMPVDIYVGGKEHAVLHLLYARFWHKFLFDLGLVTTAEPFMKLRNQGLILGENNQRMSKSRGNVINPDDIVKEFGADTFRMYEMFMGPLETSKPWNKNSIGGIRRFLDRIYDYFTSVSLDAESLPPDIDRLLHKTIKKVGEDIETISAYNTAISALMILLNELQNLESIPRKVAQSYIVMLSVFAPHIAEELWGTVGDGKPIFLKPGEREVLWPSYDESRIKDETVTYAIMISGKKRATIEMPAGANRQDVENEAKKLPMVQKYLENAHIKTIIFVQDKIINFVL
ncbi:MAG: leucine--tRNA ligase [Spirochaetes bacterium]|nr:leucine--tRNA ligase [Spirochaetota bacterium]